MSNPLNVGYSDGTNHLMKSGSLAGFSDGTNHTIKFIEVGGADGANHIVWKSEPPFTVTIATASNAVAGIDSQGFWITTSTGPSSKNAHVQADYGAAGISIASIDITANASAWTGTAAQGYAFHLTLWLPNSTGAGDYSVTDSSTHSYTVNNTIRYFYFGPTSSSFSGEGTYRLAVTVHLTDGGDFTIHT